LSLSQDMLPLQYTAQIEEGTWSGLALIPWSYFPPDVSRFNAYAIHGVGTNRVYESLSPMPQGTLTEPDFHKLDYFMKLDSTEIRRRISEHCSKGGSDCKYWKN